LTATGSNINANNKKYECEKCKDTGTFIKYSEDGLTMIAADQCECVKRMFTERRIKASKFTPAFRQKTFDNFELARVHPNAREIIEDLFYCSKDYAENFPEIEKTAQNWLALLGEPGSGKTHAMFAVANMWLPQGIDALYFPHVEGMGEIMDTFNKNKNEDEATLNQKVDHMKKARLLLWDDLFKPCGDKGGPSRFEIQITYEVLNYRYLNQLATIISSERTPEALYRIDKATARRIMERSEGHQVCIDTEFANFSLYGARE
jgi:DNA replication protein DnaC